MKNINNFILEKLKINSNTKINNSNRFNKSNNYGNVYNNVNSIEAALNIIGEICNDMFMNSEWHKKKILKDWAIGDKDPKKSDYKQIIQDIIDFCEENNIDYGEVPKNLMNKYLQDKCMYDEDLEITLLRTMNSIE